MNILAHLHLASYVKSSLIGNSVADFVKGNPYLLYSKPIADGIMLHRKVDARVDSMCEVKKAKSLFRETHRRIGGITLDLVWDHFLSKNWSTYCTAFSLPEFNGYTQKMIKPNLLSYPADYQSFMTAMWQHNWLQNYADIEFIGRVLVGMAARRPKLYRLEETLIDVKQHYQQFEALFIELYPKMMAFVKNP